MAERHGMELRLMPQMKHDVNTRQKTRLRNAMVRHNQVLAFFCEIKVLDFDEIDTPISDLDGKILRMIIMCLEETGGDKVLIVM